jgi:hypothetical protein
MVEYSKHSSSKHHIREPVATVRKEGRDKSLRSVRITVAVLNEVAKSSTFTSFEDSGTHDGKALKLATRPCLLNPMVTKRLEDLPLGL